VSGEATAPFTGILTVAAHQVGHVAEGKLDEAQEGLEEDTLHADAGGIQAPARDSRASGAVLACFGGALADYEGGEDSHEDDHGVAGDGVNKNADGASDVERAGERP
jgi:hypothetical protein